MAAFPAPEQGRATITGAGAGPIVVVGTTGESPTLSHDEHERVIAESVQAAAGRMLVMPGTGSNSTAEAVRLTKFAARAGADAALVVGPYYNRPTQRGIEEHYKALAESVEIPICVYNIPSRTGRNIEPETIIRLAELPGIAMVKEATGSLDQASQVLAATDLTLLSGDDSMTLPLMAIGGRGVISVVGNLVPADMKALCDAFDAGDLVEQELLVHLHVRHHDDQEVVGVLPRDQQAGLHLREALHRAFKVREALRRVPVHGDLDERREGQPELLPVQQGDPPGNDAGVFQRLHPAQAGGGGESHPLGEGLIGEPAVLLQLRQDAAVEAVRLECGHGRYDLVGVL